MNLKRISFTLLFPSSPFSYSTEKDEWVLCVFPYTENSLIDNSKRKDGWEISGNVSVRLFSMWSIRRVCSYERCVRIVKCKWAGKKENVFCSQPRELEQNSMTRRKSNHLSWNLLNKLPSLLVGKTAKETNNGAENNHLSSPRRAT